MNVNKDHISLFVSTAATVFLLGLQSQLVIAGYFGWTAVTSMGIGATQFAMFKGVAHSKWRGAIYTGLGGAFGITLAMVVFRDFIINIK